MVLHKEGKIYQWHPEVSTNVAGVRHYQPGSNRGAEGLNEESESGTEKFGRSDRAFELPTGKFAPRVIKFCLRNH